ncbi:MAG: condensation domain-containing protein, partial [Maribacter sp.]
MGQTQLIIPRTETNPSVLSFAQERLWFIEQYEEGTNAYHMPEVLELERQTDIEGIKYALRQIVSRHEVLRSTIEQGDDQAGIQRVHNEPLPIEEVSIAESDDHEALIREDINRPFDLKTEYPIRVKFYRILSEKSASEKKSGRTLLLINTHHVASDGWSSDVFQRELFAYYEAYVDKGTEFSLPTLEIQYKDYAVWQRTYLTGEVLGQQLSYWKDKLSGYQNLELPTDHARPNQTDYRGAYQAFTLSKKTSEKLRALAKDLGTTLHSVLLSSINILLGKYTGQQDIVIGSPIANRHHRQTEGLIGFFVNTQVNRTILGQSQSYEDLIHQVHQDQIAAQIHQDLPFEKLVEEMDVERDASRHPIFQVMFGVQSFVGDSKQIDEQSNYFKPFQGSSGYEVEKFDLSIFIDDGREVLEGDIGYATGLFHKDTIARLIDHYTYLLDQLVESPQEAYSKLSLLRPQDYEQIVYEWNATDKDYPRDKTIYGLFEEQVEKTPDNIALVFEGQQLTYGELNEKSNQLARHIRARYKKRTKQTLRPDTLIALCLDRSLEMVIGIMAVLKAGGAYVPIDPSYPQDRLDYILEDTKAELVLSQ